MIKRIARRVLSLKLRRKVNIARAAAKIVSERTRRFLRRNEEKEIRQKMQNAQDESNKAKQTRATAAQIKENAAQQQQQVQQNHAAFQQQMQQLQEQENEQMDAEESLLQPGNRTFQHANQANYEFGMNQQQSNRQFQANDGYVTVQHLEHVIHTIGSKMQLIEIRSIERLEDMLGRITIQGRPSDSPQQQNQQSDMVQPKGQFDRHTGFMSTRKIKEEPSTPKFEDYFPASDRAARREQKPKRLYSQPIFSGKPEENLTTWLDLLERNMEVSEIAEYDKVLVASTYLRDHANLFFMTMRKQELRFMEWDVFVHIMKQRFQPPNYQRVISEKLQDIKMNGTLQQYVNYFDSLLNQLEPTSITETMKIQLFVKGLRPTRLQEEVKFARPKSLFDAMAYALDYDACHPSLRY